MPMLPVPQGASQGTGPGNPLGQAVSPENFLMAAADLHQKGEFQSAPVPKGKPIPMEGRRVPKMRVVR